MDSPPSILLYHLCHEIMILVGIPNLMTSFTYLWLNFEIFYAKIWMYTYWRKGKSWIDKIREKTFALII